MKIQSILKTIALGTLVAINLVSAQATSIAWNTPIAITGDTDVSTTSTLVYAYVLVRHFPPPSMASVSRERLRPAAPVRT